MLSIGRDTMNMDEKTTGVVSNGLERMRNLQHFLTLMNKITFKIMLISIIQDLFR